MKILVWKAYGEIGTYSAESIEDIEKIISCIGDVFKHWKDIELEEELLKVVESVKLFFAETKASDPKYIRSLRNNLVWFLEDKGLTCCHDCDDFELFRFQEVKQID